MARIKLSSDKNPKSDGMADTAAEQIAWWAVCDVVEKYGLEKFRKEVHARALEVMKERGEDKHLQDRQIEARVRIAVDRELDGYVEGADKSGERED